MTGLNSSPVKAPQKAGASKAVSKTNGESVMQLIKEDAVRRKQI